MITKPLAKIYGLATDTRNLLYDSRRLSTYRSTIPIICVGNATAGGSGKTPMTDHLVQILAENGYRPVILMRGYGGRNKGPLVVEPTDLVKDVGDEALAHVRHLAQKSTTRNVKVVIARSRVAGAQLIESEQLGDIIVMDDGFQHRPLERNSDLLLLDVSSPESINQWRNGTLLPAGRLRESLGSALRRASAIVLVRRVKNSTQSNLERVALDLAEIASELPKVPIFVLTLEPDRWAPMSHSIPSNSPELSDRSLPLESFCGKKVAVLTAIAKPEFFLETIRANGAEIYKQKTLPDHRRFTAELCKKFASYQLPILCTNKDAVKLGALLKTNAEVYSLQLKAKLEPLEQREEFLEWILSDLKALRTDEKD